MGKKLRVVHFPGRNGERGQSFMELAISIVFLLWLLSVLIELGWAFYTMTSLRDTVQEAASYGIMCPDEVKIRDRFIRSVTSPINAEDIDDDDVIVEAFAVPAGSGNEWKQGSTIKITATIHHRVMVPFIGAVLTTYPLTVDVTDTVMVNECPAE